MQAKFKSTEKVNRCLSFSRPTFELYFCVWYSTRVKQGLDPGKRALLEPDVVALVTHKLPVCCMDLDTFACKFRLFYFFVVIAHNFVYSTLITIPDDRRIFAKYLYSGNNIGMDTSKGVLDSLQTTDVAWNKRVISQVFPMRGLLAAMLAAIVLAWQSMFLTMLAEHVRAHFKSSLFDFS